ncbi:MAG: RagB/SusD family nutrient uptake outer membrane protein [Bacteroidales bacterium]|nr:RagB/SusD family nutrient uptake outer membrane protein [Bacteroidales bacterium]
MKKILVFGIALLTLVSCKMDFYSSDAMTSSALAENPSSAVYTTDGIYALFKDNLEYKGTTEAGNTYLRHLFQLSESRGDNVTVSGYSEDPFTPPYRYEDVDYGKNKTYTWWMAYKIINAANANIDGLQKAVDAGADPSDKQTPQLLGENYFFRAIAHFHMVTLFARPYVCGRDLPGVPLRIGMDYSATSRAPIGEVYDAIVADLQNAVKYMDMGEPRGDASYVTATAARALLARVYLFMGDDHLEDCVKVCDELIESAPASVKGVYTLSQLQDYPKHTWDQKETIWCVHFVYPTDHPSPEATIGAMYICQEYSTNGWGEWFYSDELIELFNRYKKADGSCADNRFNAYFTYKWYPATTEWPASGKPEQTVVLNDGKQTVCFPVPFENDACYTAHVSGLEPNSNGDYVFTYEGKSYTAKKTQVNGYDRWFIDHNFTGDATFWNGKTPAYIRPDIDEEDGWGFRTNMYMPYMNTKFAWQDGQCTFSSPVMLRWGEVFLNRAEANARLGKDADALEDVNLIRKRAGLPADAMFTTGNMSTRGYESSLDVVLDERRMELCFEGDRAFSLFRNKKTLDRRYVGYHPFTTINWDDPRIALLIPSDEILTSGIAQNDPRSGFDVK